MEAVRYTEYTSTISSGHVTVQVPDDDEMPIQIIVDTGKSFILKLGEFQEICKAVVDSLRESGRDLAV